MTLLCCRDVECLLSFVAELFAPSLRGHFLCNPHQIHVQLLASAWSIRALFPVPLLGLSLSHAQLLSPFLPSPLEDTPSTLSGTTGTEAVFALALALFGLVCSLWHFIPPPNSIIDLKRPSAVGDLLPGFLPSQQTYSHAQPSVSVGAWRYPQIDAICKT